MTITQIIFLIIIGAMSFISFMLYAIDKLIAIKNGNGGNSTRIPENVLLALSIMGGAIGGLLAMLTVRHKTKHWYFWAVNLVAVAIHIAVLVFNL